jgi:hypothetical protein
VRATWTLLVSGGVHAAVGVWLWTAPRTPTPPDVTPRTLVDLELVEPPPELTPPPLPHVDDGTDVRDELPSSPSAPPRVASTSGVRGAPAVPGASAIASSVTPSEPSPPSPWLHMRGDEPEPGAGIVLDARVAIGGGVAGPPPPGPSQDALLGDPYADTVHTPNMSDGGGQVWTETLGKPAGGGRYVKKRRTFKATVEEDGTVHLNDQPNWQGGFFADSHEGVGYRASFDVTDWLMRMHGEDPYLYAKMKYLDDTRAERDQMAIKARGERLRESVHRLPKLLERVWGDANLSPAEKRRALFYLWDECAEDGPDEVTRAAEEVRVTIYAFVRRNAPRGSDAGYTDDELRAFNQARTSKAVFDPYEKASDDLE